VRDLKLEFRVPGPCVDRKIATDRLFKKWELKYFKRHGVRTILRLVCIW
jgi:hypothetical protein